MDFYLGYTGLVGIVVTIICIAISWWALQIVRFDVFTYNAKSFQAKLLQIILSIIIGYLLARFLIDYLGWSMNLKNLF